MATAALSIEASTVTYSLSRGSGCQLRVTFESPQREGFSLSELDALQVAIEVARHHLVVVKSGSSVVIPVATDSEPSLETLFTVQQSRLAAST